MYPPKFCRICISSEEELINLDSFDDGLPLFEKLISCTPEIICEETQMHRLICRKCCSRLRISYEFRQLCLRSKDILKGYVSHFIYSMKSDNADNSFVKNHEIKKEIDDSCIVQNPAAIKETSEISASVTEKLKPLHFTQIVVVKKEKNSGSDDNDNDTRENIFHDNEENEETEKNNYNTIEEPAAEFHENISSTSMISFTLKPENNITLLQCEHCSKQFKTRSHLERHLETHSTERKYKCEICEKGFLTSNSLSSHKRVHNNKKPYGCPSCDKCFKKQYDLKEHLRVHTGEKPYVCRFCKKAFSGLCRLKRHESIHTGAKPYVCDVCGKSFAEPGNLSVHKRIHTGEKPYVCGICDRGFIQLSALTKHNLIHTGEKPYSCDICYKKFNRTNNLAAHKLSHAIVKPHICKSCNKGFTVLNNLRRHEVIHSDFKPYFCEVCDKRFNHPNYLARHFQNHSNEGLEVVRTSFSVKLATKDEMPICEVMLSVKDEINCAVKDDGQGISSQKVINDDQVGNVNSLKRDSFSGDVKEENSDEINFSGIS